MRYSFEHINLLTNVQNRKINKNTKQTRKHVVKLVQQHFFPSGLPIFHPSINNTFVVLWQIGQKFVDGDKFTIAQQELQSSVEFFHIGMRRVGAIVQLQIQLAVPCAQIGLVCNHIRLIFVLQLFEKLLRSRRFQNDRVDGSSR